MGLTLTRMRALVRKGLGGLDSNELTDAETDELLNLALWELDNRFPFKEKECLKTASTVAGTRSYSLPTDFHAVQNVAIVDDEGQYHYLEEMTVEWYEDNASDDTDEQARPERWLRRDDALIVWPEPDDVYTLRMEIWKNIADMVSGTKDITGLPRNWDEIVVEGAITRGHYYRQDYNLGQQAENFRVGHERGAVLDSTIEEDGIRHAGLDVLWDDPS